MNRTRSGDAGAFKATNNSRKGLEKKMVTRTQVQGTDSGLHLNRYKGLLMGYM